MALVTLSQPRFQAGKVLMTQGVNDLIQRGVINPAPYLQRHLNGDWGDLCGDDKQLNDEALTSEGRLMSSYDVGPDIRLWIITEWDRSVTTLLLPSEY
tara:strand:+ start:6909 stop:7202 length:294 start_codon:yes stop_codon:yes gene_type:complete